MGKRLRQIAQTEKFLREAFKSDKKIKLKK